ncbi:hypothetical protein F2Q69_00048813 [Brassica cretica]|uniref:Uncharacterized protein n=1 Tax=Brassica cretica TaxID=69181 RepID=A0A8S9PTV2_BRACR|nr:hypothetical protein F2Q69_00048813 [Brassica cretica]
MKLSPPLRFPPVSRREALPADLSSSSHSLILVLHTFRIQPRLIDRRGCAHRYYSGGSLGQNESHSSSDRFHANSAESISG